MGLLLSGVTRKTLVGIRHLGFAKVIQRRWQVLNIAVDAVLGRGLVHPWLLYFLERQLIDMWQHLGHPSFTWTHLCAIG